MVSSLRFNQIEFTSTFNPIDMAVFPHHITVKSKAREVGNLSYKLLLYINCKYIAMTTI